MQPWAKEAIAPEGLSEAFEHSITWEDDIWQADPVDVDGVHAKARKKFLELVTSVREDGTAQAFLGQKDIHYGIDRVVAVTKDGRGYVWHQINDCGEVVFDGNPVPETCPKPPQG